MGTAESQTDNQANMCTYTHQGHTQNICKGSFIKLKAGVVWGAQPPDAEG